MEPKIIALIVALLLIGFWVFTKVTQALIKMAFLFVAVIVLLIAYRDQLPF